MIDRFTNKETAMKAKKKLQVMFTLSIIEHRRLKKIQQRENPRGKPPKYDFYTFITIPRVIQKEDEIP